MCVCVCVFLKTGVALYAGRFDAGESIDATSLERRKEKKTAEDNVKSKKEKAVLLIDHFCC